MLLISCKITPVIVMLNLLWANLGRLRLLWFLSFEKGESFHWITQFDSFRDSFCLLLLNYLFLSDKFQKFYLTPFSSVSLYSFQNLTNHCWILVSWNFDSQWKPKKTLDSYQFLSFQAKCAAQWRLVGWTSFMNSYFFPPWQQNARQV